MRRGTMTKTAHRTKANWQLLVKTRTVMMVQLSLSLPTARLSHVHAYLFSDGKSSSSEENLQEERMQVDDADGDRLDTRTRVGYCYLRLSFLAVASLVCGWSAWLPLRALVRH